MSKNQELINESLLLAEKGIFKDDFINQLIKADFDNLNGSMPYLKIYDKLANKYGKSSVTIRRILNK